MRNRRDPHDRRPHAAFGETDHGVFRITARRVECRNVVLRRRSAERCEDQRAGRRDERLIAAGQCVAESLHDRQICSDGIGKLSGTHVVVLEREMDDGIGAGGHGLQCVDVVDVAGLDRCAGARQRRRSGVASREPDNVVTGGEKFGNDGGADMAGSTGDENAHSISNAAAALGVQ